MSGRVERASGNHQTKTIMAKEIIVPYGAITKIAKEVNKSNNTVSLALKGATKSELAEHIRKVAKKYGGR